MTRPRLQASMSTIILIGLHLSAGTLAIANDRTMNYVQVSKVESSSEPLHLDSTKPDACGTARVTVYAFKGEASNPVVTVFADQYLGRPPEVKVSVSPVSQSRTMTSTSTVLEFKVCPMGNTTGVATVIAIIGRVRPELDKPDQKYEIRQPDPAESARVTFTVVQ